MTLPRWTLTALLWAALVVVLAACNGSDAGQAPEPVRAGSEVAEVGSRTVEPATSVEDTRAATPAAAPVAMDPRIPRDAWRYRRDLIGNARTVFGLSAPTSMLAGQVHQESAWRADARSPVGASGLAQFMPGTADWISGLYRSELGENQPLNPSWALRAQSRYMKFLYDRVLPADTDCDRWRFALSDYNGGAGWRQRRQARSPAPGDYETTADINPGIHPANQRENAHYPRAIVGRWQPIYMAAGWGNGVCV